MWGRHWHRLAASAAVFVVLVAAGCTSGHTRAVRNDPAESSASTAAVPATSTTTAPKPPPLYSFDNSVPPPPLINTGTDYPRIINSLLAYGDWLYGHRPDVSLVPNIAAPSSQVERAFDHDLPTLAHLHRRFYEIDSGPQTLTVISANDDSVSARLAQRLRRQEVVDQSGKVASSKAREEPTTTYSLLLMRARDGKWYMAALDESRTP